MDPQALFDGLANYLCLVAIITVHEFGHAVAAVRLGDDTPRLQGRITLNPLAHMDLIGTVILPLAAVMLSAAGSALAGIIIGWGRPVQFNAGRLHNRRTGPLLIAMAGPAMNVVFAVLVFMVARLGQLNGIDQLIEPCWRAASLSMLLFFFNLMPIPPLDGSYVLKHITGMTWETFHAFSRFGMVALILVIQIKEVQMFLSAATQTSLLLFSRLIGLQAG